jgi:hypothetical protein
MNVLSDIVQIHGHHHYDLADVVHLVYMLEMCPRAFMVYDYSIIIEKELDSIVEVFQVSTSVEYEPLNSLVRRFIESFR